MRDVHLRGKVLWVSTLWGSGRMYTQDWSEWKNIFGMLRGRDACCIMLYNEFHI